ncbi:ABC transporter ATP-binding protein [Methanomassiliicoccus luminyensis]|uniref:ABC transporter ATP-binding protein n=1 Tax=Methanomassiliicoccus luminyensis TaxID=1080712 RepID=UPI00037CD69F|nr:ABC transporter ATP-binding protein [Methanomassiliicoccus luminyensis]
MTRTDIPSASAGSSASATADICEGTEKRDGTAHAAAPGGQVPLDWDYEAGEGGAAIKIKAIDVKKTFAARGNGKNGSSGGTAALGGLNLAISRGEFHVILGPSGCGKSTFLDLVAGLSKATEGAVLIDGVPVSGPGPDRAVVFQQYALLPWKTALGNVEFALENLEPDKKKRQETASRYLGLVGLEGFFGHYPHELSGGMKQRVAIARALAIGPDILLMDEPFAAVDAQTREILQRDLLRIAAETGKTVLFITHSIDEAVFLADRVSVMTARPGTIKSVVPVPLTREERLHDDVKVSDPYIRTRHRLWELLKEEAIKAQGLTSEIPAKAPGLDPGIKVSAGD